MVTAIREAEASLGSAVKRMTSAEAEMFRLGRRSLVAARPLRAGTAVQRADIAVKRPGYGIEVHHLELLAGRRPVRDIAEDEVLTWDLFAG